MFGQDNKVPSIPSETVRAARAVFSRKSFYILVGERLELLLKDIQLENSLCIANSSRSGGAILPLVTFFQSIEGLTDEQAMDAVRTRIDWKFALHLPVHTIAFRELALCEFRQQVLKDPTGQREFQKLVDRLLPLDPQYNQTLQNFDVVSLLSTVCSTNVLNWAMEAMHAALGVLASRYPEWLLQIAQPHWYWRFTHSSPFANPVSSMRQQEISMEKLGADIHHLLEEVDCSNLREIRELKEIKTLNHFWEWQLEEAGAVLSVQNGTSKRINCESCRYHAG